MRVSLADQPAPAAARMPGNLAIALGANLASPTGPPLATFLAVRPLLEALLQTFREAQSAAPHAPTAQTACAWSRPLVRWSPLFCTAPLGGPAGQPDYLNAVVLVSPAIPPTPVLALKLLTELQALEQRFARQRLERWGPRSLDLDLLWWDDLRCRSEALELPHPRLLERVFVLAPLAAIDARLVPPGTQAPVGALLAQLEATSPGPAPVRLAGRPGWPEWPADHEQTREETVGPRR